MKNVTMNKFLIMKAYQKYQEEYQIILPKLNTIIYTDDDTYWAQFRAEDLYNKKYILYLNNDLMNKNNKFIIQTLYHEFTHVNDSLLLNKHPMEDYKILMSSYSEFHASQIEMKKRIKQCDSEIITLDTLITHVGLLTIKSFMEQSFNNMISALNKMKQNINIANFYYDTKKIFYFFGYIKALNCFDIEYNFNNYELPSAFMIDIMQIKDILLNDDVDIEKLKNATIALDDSIRTHCIIQQFSNLQK